MRYHIVGIGGAGMSAIAHLLLDQGHSVSGSDLRLSSAMVALEQRGVTLFVGHEPSQIVGADCLVVTSAAPPDHPEVLAARAAAIPVLKRVDLWRQWSSERAVVAVAGTHGKTTTTALIAFILEVAGQQPGYLIGGDVPDLAGSARWGATTAPLVIEADEYDRTFLGLQPDLAVITNVEWDHVDCYPTEADYDAAFAAFAAQVPAERLVICHDDLGVQRALDRPAAQSYGIDEQLALDPVACRRLPLDWAAASVQADAEGTRFGLWHYSQRSFANRLIGFCTMRLHGQHNVRNALAAIAVTSLLGVSPEVIATALARFRGTGRRFEIKGEAEGVTVIDDYAHHPTEAQATMQAARSRFGARRLVVYLQPHTYSRTKTLLELWADAFTLADLVIIGAIYAAREHDTLGIDATILASHIRHPQVIVTGQPIEAAAELSRRLQPGDVLLVLGAGDSSQVGEMVLNQLRSTR
jgi:UDP-N-acetylmuramate--alanine ligase